MPIENFWWKNSLYCVLRLQMHPTYFTTEFIINFIVFKTCLCCKGPDLWWYSFIDNNRILCGSPQIFHFANLWTVRSTNYVFVRHSSASAAHWFIDMDECERWYLVPAFACARVRINDDDSTQDICDHHATSISKCAQAFFFSSMIKYLFDYICQSLHSFFSHKFLSKTSRARTEETQNKNQWDFA